MVKITCIEDLDNISDSGAKYIAERELQQLLSLYEIDNISCFGSIFLIEDSAEFDNYSAMGLAEPINGNFEFTETYHIKKCNREEIYLFGCIIICDDLAVDILANQKILKAEQLQKFTSNISNKEYTITEETENVK